MNSSIEEKDYKFCPSCKTELARKPIDGRERLVCPACGFIFWNNPKPVVSIVLVKNGKILMIQRAESPLKDYWCLPGGFMNYDETPEETVKREAKEETQLDVEIENLVGVYRIDNDPRGVHIDIIYSGTSIREIKIGEEDENFAFFEFDNLPDKIAYKHREAIADWSKVNRG